MLPRPWPASGGLSAVMTRSPAASSPPKSPGGFALQVPQGPAPPLPTGFLLSCAPRTAEVARGPECSQACEEEPVLWRLSLLPQRTPPGLCSLDAQSTATRMAFLVRRGFCCQGKEGGLTSHCYNGPLGITISPVFLWWWVCRCTCRLPKPYCPSCQPRGGNCARLRALSPHLSPPTLKIQPPNK